MTIRQVAVEDNVKGRHYALINAGISGFEAGSVISQDKKQRQARTGTRLYKDFSEKKED